MASRHALVCATVVVLLVLAVSSAPPSSPKKPVFVASKSRSLARPFWGQSFDSHLQRGSSMSGWIAKEMVSLGPYSAAIVVGGIQQESDLCPQSAPECAGVLGLGFYNNSATGVRRSLVAQLATPTAERGAPALYGHTKPRPSPLRGIPMPHSFVALVLTPGPCEIQLGGFRPDCLVATTLQSVPVTPSCPTCPGERQFSRWEIPLAELRLGAFVLDQPDESRRPHGSPVDATSGIVDVAFSFIALPFDVYEAFAQAWNFTAPSAQKLIVTVGSISYTVPKESLCAGLTARLPLNTTCNPVLVVPATGAHVILGDPFLRAVVAMFDVSNTSAPVFGLAQRNESYVPHVVPANITVTRRSPNARLSMLARSSPEDDGSVDGVFEHSYVVALHPLRRHQSPVRVPDFYHHSVTVPISAPVLYDLAARWFGAGGAHVFAATIASAPRRLSRMSEVYANSSTASVVMTQVFQLAYFVNITIGTPRQGPFFLQVDSFSPLTAVRATSVGLPYSALTMICALAFFSLFLCGGVILVAAYVCVRSRKPAHAAWIDNSDHAHDPLLHSSGRPGSPDGEWYEEIIYTAE